MAKKTEIIKNAFDKLYEDFGENLDELLAHLHKTNKQRMFNDGSTKVKVGSTWACKTVKDYLLLEVDLSELSQIEKEPTVTKYYYGSKVKGVYKLNSYNANGYPGKVFLLRKEWDGNDSMFNKAVCDLFNDIAKKSGKPPYISEEERIMLATPGRGKKSGSKSASASPAISISKSVSSLSSKNPPLNLILYGPPGTGKTYNTINRALERLEPGTDWSKKSRGDLLKAFETYRTDGRVVLTTFHQSMSYEDFVEGIKPDLSGGTINYHIEDGIFKDISERAADNLEQNYVLIVDEINRGNIASIFGELITLIEEDKRSGCAEAISVTLPYSKASFSVPKNLYIIGTMNTADRSVEALDSALRRRFVFEEMMPRPDILRNVNVKLGTSTVTLENILRIINERIEILKDREYQIGHSYFMKYVKGTGVVTIDADDLKCEFRDKIIPLLQEYFLWN